jgi:hypothetical protein
MIEGVRRKEEEVEVADAVSKLTDKVIKNNLTAIMYMKARNKEIDMDFFDGVENTLLISK